MGWDLPWYTLTDGFDADFGVDEWHGTNAFVRDGDRVFRTYFVNSRGDEALGSVWSYLDITALGRQETWEDSPEGYPQTPTYEWQRWHDAYDGAGPSTSGGRRSTAGCPRWAKGRALLPVREGAVTVAPFGSDSRSPGGRLAFPPRSCPRLTVKVRASERVGDRFGRIPSVAALLDQTRAVELARCRRGLPRSPRGNIRNPRPRDRSLCSQKPITASRARTGVSIPRP